MLSKPNLKVVNLFLPVVSILVIGIWANLCAAGFLQVGTKSSQMTEFTFVVFALSLFALPVGLILIKSRPDNCQRLVVIEALYLASLIYIFGIPLSYSWKSFLTSSYNNELENPMFSWSMISGLTLLTFFMLFTFLWYKKNQSSLINQSE